MSLASITLSLCALAASSATAQQAAATPTFDLLKAAHAADSLRVVAARQQAALAKALQANAARADTIMRQRRELAALIAARAERVVAVDSTRVVAIDSTPVRPSEPAPSHVVQAAPVAAAAPVPVVVPAPAAAAPARPASAAPPVISGMLQLWVAGGDAGYRNTYRVRRAEVRASGTAAPKVAWTLMLDLGKALSVSTSTSSSGTAQTAVAQSSRALQDAAVMIQLHKRARLDVGQQKIPFGIEGFQSSGTLPTVERTLFASDRARGGSFGDVRDIGLSLRGRLGDATDYNVGVFNGSGESQNDVDGNLAKSVAAHLSYHAFKQLLIGASGVTAGRGAADAPLRDRVGTEVRLQTARLLVQLEGVAGRDGVITRQGMYAHAGYRVRPAFDVHARFDAWDPDRAREADAASATERDYLTGLTWNVAGTAVKAQADVVRRTYSASLVPARVQLLVNLQTNW